MNLAIIIRNSIWVAPNFYNLCSIILVGILTFASVCAISSGGEIAGHAIITEIEIIDNKLNIVTDKPFIYTMLKSSDPHKIIIELPDARLGFSPKKITSDKGKIIAVIPSQTEEPLSTRLEIIFSSPVSFEDMNYYAGVGREGSHGIGVKEGREAMPAEVAVGSPKAEEKVVELKMAVPPTPEQGVVAPVAKAAMPGEKAVIPAVEVKEESAIIRPEQKVTVPVAEVKEESVFYAGVSRETPLTIATKEKAKAEPAEIATGQIAAPDETLRHVKPPAMPEEKKKPIFADKKSLYLLIIVASLLLLIILFITQCRKARKKK